LCSSQRTQLCQGKDGGVALPAVGKIEPTRWPVDDISARQPTHPFQLLPTVRRRDSCTLWPMKTGFRHTRNHIGLDQSGVADVHGVLMAKNLIRVSPQTQGVEGNVANDMVKDLRANELISRIRSIRLAPTSAMTWSSNGWWVDSLSRTSVARSAWFLSYTLALTSRSGKVSDTLSRGLRWSRIET
jgi:hypothetical protein